MGIIGSEISTASPGEIKTSVDLLQNKQRLGRMQKNTKLLRDKALTIRNELAVVIGIIDLIDEKHGANDVPLAGLARRVVTEIEDTILRYEAERRLATAIAEKAAAYTDKGNR